MKVVADLCLIPLVPEALMSKCVAACQRVLKEAGLRTCLHAYGTNIEGEWDAVVASVKRCHELVHEMGAPRISTVLKLSTRTDREQTMEDKVCGGSESAH